MGEHSDWAELRARRMAEPGVAEAYEAARLAFDVERALEPKRRPRGCSRRAAQAPTTSEPPE